MCSGARSVVDFRRDDGQTPHMEAHHRGSSRGTQRKMNGYQNSSERCGTNSDEMEESRLGRDDLDRDCYPTTIQGSSVAEEAVVAANEEDGWVDSTIENAAAKVVVVDST